MTNDEIKEECEQIYSQIEAAEARLTAIREACKHEKTFVGNYSWRPGAYAAAHICEYCNKMIGFVEVEG